jgi:hypothetical protein
MSYFTKRIVKNQDGFMLGASILISALLLLAGVLALWSSNTEVQVVRNDGELIREFYNAEGGVIDAVANYNNGPTNWMTDAFLLAADAGFASATSVDEHGLTVAAIKIRAIEDSGATLFGAGDSADDLPRMRHISPPPAGSGYSVIHFETRRYGITATSQSGNTQVQVGVWKAFNKY